MTETHRVPELVSDERFERDCRDARLDENVGADDAYELLA